MSLRSSITIEITTITPPTAPIKLATRTLGVSGPAVMATRPARAPLSVIVKSALPNHSFANISAAITPPAAAALVLTKTIATASALSLLAIANTDPPLKPNHPSHKIKVPKVAKGRFAPRIGFEFPSLSYLPFLGPRTITPAIAAAAPAICTMPDPAKS